MRWFHWVWVLGLAGCASTGSKQVETRSADYPSTLTLLATANRFAELEPCGCSMAPLGGLQREFNLLAKWKELNKTNHLFFSAGTTFVPQLKNFQPTQLKHYQLKADYLASALDRLGVTAVSPTGEDLSLGLAHLKKIAGDHSFAWVSANLVLKGTQTPAFAPYHEVRYGGVSLFVTGVTPAADPKFPKETAVEVENPETALARMLSSLPEGPKLVVVLTSHPEAERKKLMAKFPQVNVFLGGAPEESGWNAYAAGPTTLYGVPSDMGRSLLRIDLNLTTAPFQFVSLATERNDLGRVEELRERLGALEKRKSLTAKQKREQKGMKAELEALMAKPRSNDAGVSTFESKIHVLGADLDEPKNDLTRLVDDYRKAVRESALASGETSGE